MCLFSSVVVVVVVVVEDDFLGFSFLFPFCAANRRTRGGPKERVFSEGDEMLRASGTIDFPGYRTPPSGRKNRVPRNPLRAANRRNNGEPPRGVPRGAKSLSLYPGKSFTPRTPLPPPPTVFGVAAEVRCGCDMCCKVALALSGVCRSALWKGGTGGWGWIVAFLPRDAQREEGG